jgi:hypothetical protein
LQKAAARLGPPQKESDLGDPEFMVLHALNRIDPKNWRKAPVQTADSAEERWEYISPETERDHLKPLQEEAQEPQANARMERALRIVLTDARRSSPALAAAAVKWAQGAAIKPAANETDQWMRAEATVTAAMIAARDGGAELVAAHGVWIRETFSRAFRGKNDPVHRMREGLRYNPTAIAFVGTALLLKNRFDITDVRTLLEASGDPNPAAAQGFSSVADILAQTDVRLPRAILRCAFTACVQPARQWDTSEDAHKARLEARRREVADAIEAEMTWLNGRAYEPAWPAFEPSLTHSRHHHSGSERSRERGEKKLEQYTDRQAAGLWLGKAASIFDVARRPWLRDLAKAYARWTAVANGSDLEKDDDSDRTPHEWNHAYFNLLARCLSGLTIPQIDDLALGLIAGLPGEACFDVMTIFLRSVDDVYFNGRALDDKAAVHIRAALARRLMASRVWEWQRRERSDRITMHLGPAIATLLFNDFGHLQPAKCYLFAKAIERLDPFLPVLQELAESGLFLFMATTLLNLLEVAPRPAHLGLICAAAKSWLAAHPDSREFWIGHAIGRRICALIEAILRLDPTLFSSSQPVRREIDEFLGRLVRLGVSEAHRLEEALRPIQ